jgi:phosphopantetheinyl transferase
MPLINIKRYPNGHSVGLYHIDESIPELLEQVNLSKKEQDLFEEYTHEEKKKEWCAARVLIRELCSEAGITYEGMCKDENGKPLLSGSNAEISISHSYPYVAAIMHPTSPVGIDLEQPKAKLKSIAPRFLNHAELELAQNDTHKLCILWCAKETLYKIYSKRGLIFRENLEILPEGVFPWKTLKGIIFNSKELTYQLVVVQGNDFYMVHNA